MTEKLPVLPVVAKIQHWPCRMSAIVAEFDQQFSTIILLFNPFDLFAMFAKFVQMREKLRNCWFDWFRLDRWRPS